VVVTGPDLTGPKVAAAVDALRARTSAGGPVRGPVTATSIGGGRVLVVNVQLAGNGQDSTSFNALTTLRDQDLPATLGTVPGISYAVAGGTAASHDTIQAVHDNTPRVFAVVAVLAFVVLLAGFRSIVIPVVSIVLNLLSVAAAYGLITLIFQDGRLQGLLGYTAFGGITWWVPLFMFVLLFGISMDYHVFILSRIREHWTRGSSPREAIVEGIASSAGVVTSAALIMVAVFSIFLTLPFIELKVLGIGMAAAVLIDATVVRGVLLPAALSLVGDSAWRLRRRADHGAAPLRYQHGPPRTTAHRPQHPEERSRP
jgi:RND superfamily putative drug exporter